MPPVPHWQRAMRVRWRCAAAWSDRLWRRVALLWVRRQPTAPVVCVVCVRAATTVGCGGGNTTRTRWQLPSAVQPSYSRPPMPHGNRRVGAAGAARGQGKGKGQAQRGPAGRKRSD